MRAVLIASILLWPAVLFGQAAPAPVGNERWLNTTYGHTLYPVGNKQWVQVTNKTGAVTKLTETGRSDDYVELYNPERRVTLRLSSTRLEKKVGEEWKRIAQGHWDKRAAGQMRTWTDDTGKHKTEAKFIKVDGDDVHLKKPDGSTKVVPLRRLSEADRKWIERRNLSPSAKAYFEQAELQRADTIMQIETELRQEETNLKKQQRARNRSAVLEAKDNIKTLRNRLASLRKNDPPFTPTLDILHLEVGDAGVPEIPATNTTYRFEVIDIIDDDEMIVVCCHSTRQLVNAGGNSRAQAAFVFRRGPTIHAPVLWIQGIPTSNIADKETVTLKGPMYVARTKTYEAIDGSSNTMRVLQAIKLP